MQFKKKITAILRFFFPTIVAIVVAFILFKVLFGLVTVPSTSMENTIPKNSLSFMIRDKLIWSGYNRRDIIVFQPSPENSDVIDENNPFMVKRIVGIAGDTVEIRDGVTYVNGIQYEEPWLAEVPASLDFGPYEVEEGKLFVMGDNRNHSVDSRYWIDPYVDIDSVIGKVVYVFKR